MSREYSMIVVDDEPAARACALQQIEWRRLVITALYEAGNGLDALEILETKKPELMILDIRMPGMDGVTLLDEICRRKYEISVIGLSGYSDFEAARKMLSSQKVVEYLLKPASVDALFEAVTRCLGQIEEREQTKRLRQGLPPDSTSRWHEWPEPGPGLENLHALPPGGQDKRLPDDRNALTPNEREALPPAASGRKSAAVRSVKEYLKEHYAEKLSLEQIAAQVYMNPSYLSRLFTEVEGIGLHRYLQTLRIEKAKELLRDPRYKVYEVADQVGYPNFQHFLKLFKQLEHTTPSKYRENAEWLFDPNDYT